MSVRVTFPEAGWPEQVTMNMKEKAEGQFESQRIGSRARMEREECSGSCFFLRWG